MNAQQPLTAKKRIASIDLLRGIVMIIMALDHARDYLNAESFYFDPADLKQTTASIFFTRWITHFCAPIFMLLAGTSAFLTGQKKTKKQLSFFLLTRGLWLVFLEMSLLSFAWSFNIHFPIIFFITVWALGVGMIVLAALIHLPKKIILVFAIVVIAGHNLLDTIHIPGNTFAAFGWAILHEQNAFQWFGKTFLIGYPLIPWVAVMALGYCLGQWYAPDYDENKRRKNLLTIGTTALIFFIGLRYSNIYGDPVKWTEQKSPLFTFLSFINVSKYPPSLLYLSLTIGAGLIFLSLTEKINNGWTNVVSVFGRVPMFYYLLHIYLIHLIALLASAFTPGQDWRLWILNEPIWETTGLKGYGFSLPVIYFIWALIVIALYPLCKKYDRYKQANKQNRWLSYL